MIIAMNIGWFNKEFGGGIFTYTPMLYEVNSFKEFAESIRKESEFIISIAVDRHVFKSSMCLYLKVWEDETEWDFTVRMENVREYKKLMKKPNTI